MRTFIFAALILTVFNGVSGAQPVAQGGMLTVQGQGRVQVPPDHASLTVEVVTRGKSPEAATAAHRERASRAVSALRDMNKDGVEIERSVFRLDEVRQQPGPASTERRSEPEYQAITTFELRTKQISKVDGAVTAIAATGLFQVRNMSFGIDQRNPGMKAARKSAVDDARDRATTYAEAAGVQLGEILRIDDTDGRVPRDFAVAAPMMRSVQVIPPETLTLSASVTMTWRIGARP